MVLAGQRPEVIMEICTRAVSFWTYQVVKWFNVLIVKILILLYRHIKNISTRSFVTVKLMKRCNNWNHTTNKCQQGATLRLLVSLNTVQFC